MAHITVSPVEGNWTVRAGGAVIGETTRALQLVEGDRAPVIYFPRKNIAMVLLEPSTTTTQCPHKGTATYFSLQTKSELIPDAAWSYESPKDAVAQIAGYLAFNADSEKVTVEET